MDNYFVLGAAVAVAALLLVLLIVSRCIRYVGNNRVAIVEKLWSRGRLDCRAA